MTRRRAKPYRPKPVRNPLHMRLKVEAVFAPLEHALAGLLETGQMAAENGTPIFSNHMDGEAYEFAPAMAGVATMFEMWSIRTGKSAPHEDMSRLCGLLATGGDVDEALVRRVYESLPELRRIALAMGEDEAADLVRQTQIKIELENSEKVAALEAA